MTEPIETKNLDKIHGGPQKNIFAINYILFALLFLTAIVFFLIIYAILQDNAELLLAKKNHHLVQMKLLDLKTSFTIFISLLGLILLRHHFLEGFKPRIVYETKKCKTPTFDAYDFEGEIWQVKIRNVGLGAATILDYEFRFHPSKITNKKYLTNYSEVIKEISKEGVNLESEYYLDEITAGYTLPSKEEIVLFEMETSSALKLKQLDLKIEFTGFLGGKYSKEIFLLPRLGINFEELLITRTQDDQAENQSSNS